MFIKKSFIFFTFIVIFFVPISIYAEESKPPAVEKTVKAFVASVKRTTSKFDRISWTEGRFMSYNNVIRLGEVSGEYLILDMNLMRKYRIFPKDKIYFVDRIDYGFTASKARDGEVEFNTSPNIEIKKIKLMEKELNGIMCDLVMVVRRFTQKSKESLPWEYTLMWEAKGMGNKPVRSEYVRFDYTKILVEYNDPHFEDLPASTFAPPKDFRSLSPF